MSHGDLRCKLLAVAVLRNQNWQGRWEERMEEKGVLRHNSPSAVPEVEY